jgi:GT2 family glycosyltransferase
MFEAGRDGARRLLAAKLPDAKGSIAMLVGMFPSGRQTSSLDLSVCILTHSQAVLLRRCVAACVSEIERARLAAEIIIIDNASRDRYPDKLAALTPIIRIIRNEENLGFGVANNRAIRMSSGRLVLILNDDAILEEGSLKLMVSRLESDPRIGAIGPSLLNPDGSLQSGYMNKRLPHLRGLVCELLGLDQFLRLNPWTRAWLTMWDDPKNSPEPEQLAGACLLVRRQALDQESLFDEGFYYLLEDADLSYRLRKAGWRILCVQAAHITHHGGATFSRWSPIEQRTNYFRSYTYFFKKHSSPVKYFLVRLALGLVIPIWMCERAIPGIMRRSWTYIELANETRANFRLLRSTLWAWGSRRPREGSFKG